MSRAREFVLGLIGGILGFIGAFFALFVGSIDSAFSSTGTSSITALGWSAVIFSIIGIIGSVVVKGKAKLGGILMIISAIGGLISISMIYALSFVLLLIGGLMGILRKDQSQSIEV